MNMETARAVDVLRANIPETWADLIEALVIMAPPPEGRPGSDLPTHCGHDVLTVMTDPVWYTATEIERLEELGFNAEDGVFSSSRFGSA